MVDNWFLNNNHAIGTVFLLISILALLIAIVCVSQLPFFIFAFVVGLVFLTIGSYYWHGKSLYFNAKI